MYTPVSGVPIVWRKLLHEQLLAQKIITKDEVVVVCFFLNYQQFYYKIIWKRIRGDSNTDAQLMGIVTVL